MRYERKTIACLTTSDHSRIPHDGFIGVLVAAKLHRCRAGVRVLAAPYVKQTLVHFPVAYHLPLVITEASIVGIMVYMGPRPVYVLLRMGGRRKERVVATRHSV